MKSTSFWDWKNWNSSIPFLPWRKCKTDWKVYWRCQRVLICMCICVCVCDFCFNLSSVVDGEQSKNALDQMYSVVVLFSWDMLNHRFYSVCRNEFLHLTKYRYLLNEWMGFRDITNELCESKAEKRERARDGRTNS